MVRASFGSSVVTEIATLTRSRLAMRARMSRSRSTSADLVTMPTGWPARSNTSRMRAHDLIAPLDRLIRIGIGADGDDFRHVARRRQFALQQFRRVRLHEQLRFEIEPRRQPEIGVGRPRETIDAAVLAAAIRIDRTVEGNVRRIVAGDDLARRIDRHRGLERRQFLQALPAVVEGDARQRLVTAGRIRHGAAAAAALAVDHTSQARPPARRAAVPAGVSRRKNDSWTTHGQLLTQS